MASTSTAGARRATHGALLAAVAVVALASPVGAATLHPGDLILAQGVIIYQIDPVTLTPTAVSGRPFITVPMALVVDDQGRILVADYYQGVVHVDAATGEQSVLADPALLGGIPVGICRAPGGDMFVSVRGATPGVVRLAADASSVTPVTSGDRISYPGNLTLGPDGALYVAENSIPGDNGGVINGVRGHGSIVRVDPGSGAQTVIAADSLFLGPFDIAFVGPNEIWTANHGYVAGRRGCFVSTRVGDGASAFAVQYSPCRSQGIAVAEDGTVFVSDCNTIGPDCYTRYIRRLPDGPELMNYGGPIAIVPSFTPTRRSTWGSLKAIYR